MTEALLAQALRELELAVLRAQAQRAYNTYVRTEHVQALLDEFYALVNGEAGVTA